MNPKTIACDPFVHKVFTCAICDVMTRASQTKVSNTPQNNTWIECTVTHLPVEIENVLYYPGEKYYLCPDCYNKHYEEAFGERS
jgi:hypothetical protein